MCSLLSCYYGLLCKEIIRTTKIWSELYEKHWGIRICNEWVENITTATLQFKAIVIVKLKNRMLSILRALPGLFPERHVPVKCVRRRRRVWNFYFGLSTLQETHCVVSAKSSELLIVVPILGWTVYWCICLLWQS